MAELTVLGYPMASLSKLMDTGEHVQWLPSLNDAAKACRRIPLLATVVPLYFLRYYNYWIGSNKGFSVHLSPFVLS